MHHLVDSRCKIVDFIVEVHSYSKEELIALLEYIDATYSDIKDQLYNDNQLKLKDRRGSMWSIGTTKIKALTKLMKCIVQTLLKEDCLSKDNTLGRLLEESNLGSTPLPVDGMSKAELYLSLFILREKAIQLRAAISYANDENALEYNSRPSSWKTKIEHQSTKVNVRIRKCISLLKHKHNTTLK